MAHLVRSTLRTTVPARTYTPEALAELDAKAPEKIGQGNYMKTDYDDELLNLFRSAYLEAQSGQSDER